MVKCWQILEFEIYYLVLHIEAHVHLVIIFANKIHFSDMNFPTGGECWDRWAIWILAGAQVGTGQGLWG